MPEKKKKKPDVKRLTERLLIQEFGDCLLGVWFKGPWEDIDMRANMLLKGEPPDCDDRLDRVDQALEKAGYFVIVSHDVWDELEEEEKQDWQSLWQPVDRKKAKVKTT